MIVPPVGSGGGGLPVTSREAEELAGVLRESAELLILHAPLQTTKDDLAAAAKSTPAGLNAAAAKSVHPDRGVLVLVGDKDLILKQIKDLGLPKPIEVDAAAKPVPSTPPMPDGKWPITP